MDPACVGVPESEPVRVVRVAVGVRVAVVLPGTCVLVAVADTVGVNVPPGMADTGGSRRAELCWMSIVSNLYQ